MIKKLRQEYYEAEDWFKSAYGEFQQVCNPDSYEHRKSTLLWAIGAYLDKRIKIEQEGKIMDKQINKIEKKEKVATAQLKSALKDTGKLKKMDKVQDRKLKKAGVKAE